MLGLMGLIRLMGLIIKCFAFFANLENTWEKDYLAWQLPPALRATPSLGKTSKEGDLFSSFSIS